MQATRRTLPALVILLAAAPLAAQEVQGNYTGQEKVTVTHCGPHNGQLTGVWSTANGPVENGRYSFEGRTARGRFSGTGEVDGPNTAKQKVTGSDDDGSRWSATSSAVLEGDRLRVSATGTVNGTSCRFTSEIEALRDPPQR